MTANNIIGKISYNNQTGFMFVDTGDIVKFTNRSYECTVKKSAINAVEYRVVRNWGFLAYAVLVGLFFLFRAVTAPAEFSRQLAGYWGQNLEYTLIGLGVSGVIALGIYLYPNSRLIIHAGSFKCVLDGPDEKLIRIAARLHL